MKGEDARFAHLKNDPRFKKIGKDKRKVKIDNRFKHMFTAPEFSSVDFMDKRGRKEKQVTKEKLERFYEMSSESDDHSDQEEKIKMTPDSTLKIKDADKTEESVLADHTTSTEASEEEIEKEEKEAENDYASDSSDGESTEDEEEVSPEAALDAWDEVNTCTETTSESTKRVSICNLNWDRMNATDIFVLCNSSLNKKTGKIERVEIFPSQYGKSQLMKEQENGPDIRFDPQTGDSAVDKEYSEEALRKYQIDRLKYYYAIVTCDSAATADILYSELDGVEYQLSSSLLDLRYVPDDMEFDDDPPTSFCDSIPDMATYKPPTFVTTALQNSSVKLTWDETPQSRLNLTTKKLTAGDLETMDFSAIIASSESESDSEEGGPSLEKYKALLAGEEEGEDDDVDKEMEITWTTGLEGNKEVLEEADKNEERQENSTFYAPDEKDDFFATDTVIDRPKKKKKKKKKEAEMTKEESELALLMESEKDEKKHFNMKKIIQSKKEDDFTVDIDDDRFSALKSSHHYAIDPSAPEYKETAETQKLRAAQAVSMTMAKSSKDGESKKGDDIIKKIKNRTAQFQSKKDNSKLFKTKNKGVILAQPADSSPVVKEVKKKKRSLEDAVCNTTGRGDKKKKKKKRVSLKDGPEEKTKRHKKTKVAS